MRRKNNGAEVFLSAGKQERRGAVQYKVQATIHWVSIVHAITVEVRLYDRLFRVEDPANEEGDFKEYINPDSLQVIGGLCRAAVAAGASSTNTISSCGKGYFYLDKDSSEEKMIFNRTTTLRDNWVKEQKKI
jgi:glutaminyl-tRNA synthetase